MLFAHRFRVILIRCGLGLIAVVSLAVMGSLLTQSIMAYTSAGAKSSSTVATVKTTTTAAAPIKPHTGVAEAKVSSSADELASMERAREQIASLVRADDRIDWSALVSDASSEELLPASFEDVDQLVVLTGMDSSPQNFASLGTQLSQLADADQGASGTYAAMFGGGSGISGWGGGGGASSGGGGSTNSRSPVAASSSDSGYGNYANSSHGSAGSSAGLNANSVAVDVHNENSETRNAALSLKNGSNGGSDRVDTVVTNGNANARGRGDNVPAAPGLGRAGAGSGGPNNTTSVPEPSTMLLTALGLSSLTMSRLRKRRAGQ